MCEDQNLLNPNLLNPNLFETLRVFFWRVKCEVVNDFIITSTFEVIFDVRESSIVSFKEETLRNRSWILVDRILNVINLQSKYKLELELCLSSSHICSRVPRIFTESQQWSLHTRLRPS